MTGEELVELISALVEGKDAANGVVTRDKANDERWCIYKGFGDPCVEDEGQTTDFFEDIIAVTLIYVV